MTHSADYWIATLGLRPHPEGGFYSETYRSPEMIPAEGLPSRYGAARSFSTAIYFLLKGDQISALHRLRSDEMWHFHAGGALVVHIIEADGAHRAIRVGPEPEDGDRFQALAPAGCWFGAELADAGGFALVGCTVAPGFSFDDFELGDRDHLLRLYPRHQALIERLTR